MSNNIEMIPFALAFLYLHLDNCMYVKWRPKIQVHYIKHAAFFPEGAYSKMQPQWHSITNIAMLIANIIPTQGKCFYSQTSF